VAFTIATGPSDGSYFQIAQDIKNVVGKEGIDLNVMATKGSLENLELLTSGKADLAIVQLDALRFISDVTARLGSGRVRQNQSRPQSVNGGNPYSHQQKKTSRRFITWKASGCRWDRRGAVPPLRLRCSSTSMTSSDGL
jgi:hypothetical protein